MKLKHKYVDIEGKNKSTINGEMLNESLDLDRYLGGTLKTLAKTQ